MEDLKRINMEDLLGQTINSIKFIKQTGKYNLLEKNDCLIFEIKQRTSSDYFFMGSLDETSCCGGSALEDISGDLKDIIGTHILLAEESCSAKRTNEKKDDRDQEVWTFYKFATIKGYVTLRWVGSCNGYYSNKTELYEINDKELRNKVKLLLDGQ